VLNFADQALIELTRIEEAAGRLAMRSMESVINVAIQHIPHDRLATVL
jgi:hypothetical protein